MLYRVVTLTGYSERTLERTSPEFIQSLLRGDIGWRKAEAEREQLQADRAASANRARP